jgi:hypothetical protein
MKFWHVKDVVEGNNVRSALYKRIDEDRPSSNTSGDGFVHE